MGFKTGMFKYFNELDEDCSGFLEPDEITSLALKFFGEHKQKACEEYVERVFREYDVDESGELSYEEAREFLKGIMAFLDSTGELSEEARAAFMEAMIEEEDSEEEDEGEPVNDGDGNTDIGNGDITDNNNGEQVVEEVIEAKAESGAGATMEADDNYTPPKSNYKVPEAKVMIDPIPVGPDGKPRLGRFGELLDENGIQILGPGGCMLGPDGKPLPVVIDDNIGRFVQGGKYEQPFTVGPNGELMDANGKPIVGENGELLTPTGEVLLGPGGCLLGPDGKPMTGEGGGVLGPDGKVMIGPDGKPLKNPSWAPPADKIDSNVQKLSNGLEMAVDENGNPKMGPHGGVLSPDGSPLLGKWGQLIDKDGNSVLVNPGVIIGPDGKQLLLNKGEIRNPHDGEAFVGKYGEILDVEANAIVQQFNNIQNPKGEAILGHLTRGTEETKLTSAGGLLDPNGQPILGPKPEPGCLLDINGKPIKPYLNKYGERMDTGDGGDNSGSKFTVGEGMGDTGYSGSGGASRPDFQYQRPAETNSQKSNLRKAIAKKWEIKKPEGHDGFCPLLRIYRPRTSMKKKDELENLPAKVRRFKWVRDPISDQWIHVERIGEEARAA